MSGHDPTDTGDASTFGPAGSPNPVGLEDEQTFGRGPVGHGDTTGSGTVLAQNAGSGQAMPQQQDSRQRARAAVLLQDVTLIPDCQRNEGWNEGADLLDFWLRSGEHVIPDQVVNFPAEETIITMSWVLSPGSVFQASREAHDQILNHANYTTDNSKALLLKRLQDDPAFNMRAMTIGETKQFHHYSAASAASQHHNHIQTIEVKGAWSGNELSAALANFNFHLLARGEVQIVDASTVQVTINGVGVYVRDGFDFEGDQLLGCWDLLNMKYHGTVNWAGHRHVLCVSNATFRSWRARNHMGGDFRVFSDIEDHTLSNPYSFTRTSRFTFKPAPAAPQPTTHEVQRGDTLWGIAETYYGNGHDWPRIYAANSAIIGPDPNRIEPGQVLTIP